MNYIHACVRVRNCANVKPAMNAAYARVLRVAAVVVRAAEHARSHENRDRARDDEKQSCNAHAGNLANGMGPVNPDFLRDSGGAEWYHPGSSYTRSRPMADLRKRSTA
jgi:hypothetical protein